MSRHQAHITLVNGVETSALSIADRGLAYGDGLFETMRLVKHEIPLLDYHLARFKRGVDALSLGEPDELADLFLESLNQAKKEGLAEALVKIIVTRGSGGRGYGQPEEIRHNVILQVFDSIDPAPFRANKGLSIVESGFRLGLNPALAGVKHLNRLEQVMASRDLNGAPEAIVFDLEDQLIEGTKSNILLFEKDKVVTPKLHRCGIRGVLRDYLLAQSSELGFPLVEDDICRQRLAKAKGMVLINSVFGMQQVKQIQMLGGEHPVIEFDFDARAKTLHEFLQGLAY